MTRRTTRSSRAVIAAAATVGLLSGGALTASSVGSPAPATAHPTSSTTTAATQADDHVVQRIAGPNRYGTAAEAVRAFDEFYPGWVSQGVIVASGQDFPDALSAGVTPSSSGFTTNVPGAGLPAPLLLTRETSLPAATIAALEEFSPENILIVGGEDAVSAEVEEALGAYTQNIIRIGGATRYETSANLALSIDWGLDPLPVMYVATGQAFPDALTIGARAATAADGSPVPVLLTHPDQLRTSTAAAISELSPEAVVVLGGPQAVSEDVFDAIAEIVPDTARLAGQDRYETAAIIASTFQYDTGAFVATGTDYPDALAGNGLAGALGVPLVLTRPASLHPSASVILDHLSPEQVWILGGLEAVGDPVEQALNAQLPVWIDELVVQLLSFNDYHGHLEVDPAARLTPAQDPDQHPVGGAVNLASTLELHRQNALEGHSLTVAAGDLIGGSTFVSGLFQDEPAVETLGIAGLDISSVGNHEFDEGLDELLRMQEGGCHPTLGCFIEDEPYAGADFQWLAANVVYNDDHEHAGESVLPGTEVREIDGVPVGFIGMTLEATPTLVSPAGVADLEFLDEVDTANEHAAALQAQGVETIVVLLHEGGFQTGTYNGCEGISGPIVAIAEALDPAIDAVVTGHTHQPYVCSIDDPDGNPRSVTSANQYARVITDTRLAVSRETGDVIRDRVLATNNLVLQSAPDHPEMAAAVAKWVALAEVLAGEVVGTIDEDITGDAGGDRGIETPMANLVADSILWGTAGADAGAAQISFMNVGGVRASLLVDQITNDEEPGEVTYQEAYNVMPFNNLLVSIDLTGEQIKAVLEQQYIPSRGRPDLALGVSEGFTYDWDGSAPQNERVSNMALDGVPLELDETYRVSTLNFLADGGDEFTAFTDGTNRLGGPEDLANFVAYLGEHPDLVAPPARRNDITP